MNKHVIILRGLPGSGKTFFSSCCIRPSFVVSMDHYWTREGRPYKFDYNELAAAIKWTQDLFLDRLHDEEAELDTIIVDNVSYMKEHFQFFVDEAKKAGAVVHIIHVERPLSELDSSHNVPREKVLVMAARWEPIR